MNIPRDWTFKSIEVANEFDRHVREQLPWYDLTTGIVTHVARHYIPFGGYVYDIGASTGNVGRAIEDTLRSREATLVAIDESESMMEKYSGPGQFIVSKAETFAYKPFDLAICFLVLMFVKPSSRPALLSTLRSNMRDGGAIVIFDKCIQCNGYVGTVMSRMALAGKVAAGVNASEVISKELSLSGFQRPLNPNELGNDAQEIFRFGDFAGWIIEKS